MHTTVPRRTLPKCFTSVNAIGNLRSMSLTPSLFKSPLIIIPAITFAVLVASAFFVIDWIAKEDAEACGRELRRNLR